MIVQSKLSIDRVSTLLRTTRENIKATVAKKETSYIYRMCVDDVKINSENKRILSIFRNINDGLKGLDNQTISFVYVRTVTDEAKAIHKSSHWGSFVRGLFVTAGNTAKTTHEANYHRYQADTVQTEGSVFRGLLLFVRIATQVFIRDYLLSRLLKARQEIMLKSCICRELTLYSKVG
jgi:hypothetical protein